MRKLPSFGPEFGVAPTEEPLSYPGVPPKDSTLLLGNAVLRLHERSRRRLPQWRVEVDEHTVPGERRAVDQLPLSHVLLRHNQTPMAGRVPVLAVGSNASPAQMWGKFSRAGVSPVLPMVLAAEIRGVAVGISAHISAPGYLPTTPVLDPDARSRLFIVWPDRTQLAAIDDTEPNYHRVLLSEPDFSFVLPSGENLSHCYAYFSRHGNLTDDTGAPLFHPGRARDPHRREHAGEAHPVGVPARPRARGAAGPGRAPARREPEPGRDAAGAGPADLRRPGVGAALAPAGRAGRGVRWRRHDARRPVPAVTYGDRAPAHRVPDGTFRARPTTDDFDRHGQAAVRVAPSVANRLGANHVLVSLAEIGDMSGAGIRALSRVVAADGLAETEAEVDQILRNSVGAEVGEDVVLAPVKVTGSPVADAVFGRPNYVTCRVQTADLTTVEREVCLLDELTLNLLGVQAGDEVVIEGWATRRTRSPRCG